VDKNNNDIEFYGNILLSSLMNINNFSNIKLLKCFKLVFSKLGQKNNIGSIIFIIIIIIFIIIKILLFIYFKKEIIRLLNIISKKIIQKNLVKKTWLQPKKNLDKIQKK